ncbi:hypothetical protein Cme02nite_20870 [Catellatospora methionotrophica]|uniref:Uncharacterized protein n=1 Tax=Catellatospora methionotrophica TaxID=121620 RepID=A0A8J3LJD1_9ACTN|nr:hypothetical protein [Catellatospora methionotrophica]GIG13755.1 hypothetical protein Cme02nite_20870 [Catellatospora methionotrophica]
MNARAITSGRPARARRDESAGHPEWCEGGHHCTAFTMPDGAHQSRPETWLVEYGRLVGTRRRDRSGRDRVELRVMLDLADDEHTAQAQARHLMAVTHLVIGRVFGTDQPAGVRS